ncbi:MAG: hypothetical protein EHM21_15280, partial [Chloroflexi bacterium]
MTHSTGMDGLHNLPHFPIPIFGREKELDELSNLLAEPGCRFITVTGSGGIGKTRLALEAAQKNRGLFPGGVYFLSLQNARPDESISAAMVQAVGLPLGRSTTAEEQLASYLADGRVLFLLDNFEDLLSPGEVEGAAAQGRLPAAVSALLRLLEACPGLKMLVTSRQALAVQEEWLFPIQGLALPEEGAGDPASSPAVRLFIERSQRLGLNRSFSADLPAITRICRQVEGVPLAIEMAATWTGSLTCAAIAREIEKSLLPDEPRGMLSSAYQDTSERQCSMQVVFDHSWRLLSSDERRAFARLSIFPDGFKTEAAVQITGTDLPLLAGLVRKSMIWLDARGRYRMHALLRQYAGNRLRDDPEESDRTSRNFCAYYASFVHELYKSWNLEQKREMVLEFSAEIENILAAWYESVRRGCWEEIYQSILGFRKFFDLLGRYQDCIDALQRAAQGIESQDD